MNFSFFHLQILLSYFQLRQLSEHKCLLNVDDIQLNIYRQEKENLEKEMVKLKKKQVNFEKVESCHVYVVNSSYFVLIFHYVHMDSTSAAYEGCLDVDIG